MVKLLTGGEYSEGEIKETLEKILRLSHSREQEEFFAIYVAQESVMARKEIGDTANAQQSKKILTKEGLIDENGKIINIVRDVIKSAVLSSSVRCGIGSFIETKLFRYENIIQNYLAQDSFKALSNISIIADNEITESSSSLGLTRINNVEQGMKDSAEEEFAKPEIKKAFERIKSLTSDSTYKKLSNKVKLLSDLQNKSSDKKYQNKFSTEEIGKSAAKEMERIANNIIDEFTNINKVSNIVISNVRLSRIKIAIGKEISDTLQIRGK